MRDDFSRMEKYIDILINHFEKFERSKDKETAYKFVCIARAIGVRAIASFCEDAEDYKLFERRKKKAEKLLPEWVKVDLPNPMRKIIEVKRELIAICGSMIAFALDDWQDKGGTFRELCNLCNISEDHAQRIISKYADDEDDGDEIKHFSHMIFIYFLDDKSNKDYLEIDPAAPLSVCIKEDVVHLMKETAEGCIAGLAALMECLPEISECMVLSSNEYGGFDYVDDDGQIHHFDENGIEIFEDDF